jgi:hypothetical protein
MPQYSITAESATAGYSVTRHQTEDGTDTVFKNLKEATTLADHWVATLNEEKFAETDDWLVTVEPSSK